MRTVRIRLLPAAILALGLLGLVAPAASASTSNLDRLLAAGAGTSFTGDISATSFQNATCFVDPEGDVVNLDDSDEDVTESRGDIVEYCVNLDSERLMLTASMAEPTSPTTDENWQGSAMTWFLDVDGDGEGEYFVEASLDEDTLEMTATLQDRTTAPPTPVMCDADFTYEADAALTVTIPVGCIDSPNAVAISAGMIYDQRITDVDGVATLDIAPNEGGYGDAVARPGFFPDGVTVIEGEARVETAIAISQATFDTNSADYVVIARDQIPPDALAGTPLAIDLDAPILLNPVQDLREDVAAEIERVLDPEGEMTVVILGGNLAISDEVQAELDETYETMRYGGLNRFETAVAIAGGLDNPGLVLAADGADVNWQYPMVAGPAAASVGAAVLLTDGETVPPATQAYFDSISDEIHTIGADATAAVTDPDSSTGDDDPVQTAVDVATEFFDTATVGISRDDVFADALTGGAVIGNPRLGPGPMLLVQTDELPEVVEEYLVGTPIRSAVIFGGVNAVSQDVRDAIATAIE